jgi:hypothetical protein
MMISQRPSHHAFCAATLNQQTSSITMPRKPRFLLMDKDNIIWQKPEDDFDEWMESARKTHTYRAVGNFILKHKPGQAEVMHQVIKGGYNVFYRREYKDGTSVVMRVPIPGVM